MDRDIGIGWLILIGLGVWYFFLREKEPEILPEEEPEVLPEKEKPVAELAEDGIQMVVVGADPRSRGLEYDPERNGWWYPWKPESDPLHDYFLPHRPEWDIYIE